MGPLIIGRHLIEIGHQGLGEIYVFRFTVRLPSCFFTLTILRNFFLLSVELRRVSLPSARSSKLIRKLDYLKQAPNSVEGGKNRAAGRLRKYIFK